MKRAVDAGGARRVVAAAGFFGPGFGVGVPGDVMRQRGPVIAAAHLQLLADAVGDTVVTTPSAVQSG